MAQGKTTSLTNMSHNIIKSQCPITSTMYGHYTIHIHSAFENVCLDRKPSPHAVMKILIAAHLACLHLQLSRHVPRLCQ